MLGRDVLRRFWDKVEKSDGCWEWMGYRNPKGYGHFRARGRARLAHRVSWEIHHGEDPGDLCVLHKCDNPSCVRPDHIELGTIATNQRQMVARGRSARGVRNWKAKLDPDKVREIRRLAQRHTYRDVARMFDTTCSTISNIVNRKEWRHVA